MRQRPPGITTTTTTTTTTGTSVSPSSSSKLSSLSTLSMDPHSHYPVSQPGKSSSSASRIGKSARREKQRNVCAEGSKTGSHRHATTFSMFPGDVLLEIFDFCQKNGDIFLPVWNWHPLVHVCRRWRQIVFASPRRLGLQILCTYGTPVRNNLSIWPAIPIVIDLYSMSGIPPNDEDNVIAALDPEHLDRICSVKLDLTGSQLGKVATVMQKTFPVLKCLRITSEDAPKLPAGFLGGSAPCLQEISLYGVPYPTLPTLLLSATDLFELDLRKIPPTGYISPEAMVASLAALPRLEILIIGFQSHPDQRRPPPVTHNVRILPALTYFEFNGASEYLEDLVARIDSPQLNQILIVYLNQVVDFQVPQLSLFVHRSVGPELTLFKHAHVTFSRDKVTFNMCSHANYPCWDWCPTTTSISCEGIDWQVSHMAGVLSQFSTTLSNVVHLKLEAECQLKDTDDVEWLDLLLQFPTAQTLHVSRKIAVLVALALEDIPGEMVAEVLPSLELICLAGQPAFSIEKFIAGRRLSGRPVTVIDTET